MLLHMTTIDIRDTTLYYERSGTGPSTLFVHGMCGGGWVWAEQVARLSPALDCVTYDRRGHSRSGPGTLGQANTVHADDAAALIEALDLAPCLVVASSGGACIGLELCLRHPRLLRGAVLSEPPQFTLDPDGGRRLRTAIGPALQAAETGGPRQAVDAFFTAVCPGLWARLSEARRDRYRDNAAMLMANLTEPPTAITREDLRAVDVPVLAVTGRDSHPALRALTTVLAAEVPGARLLDLPDCGHVTYAEQPAAFASAVSAFAVDTRTGLAGETVAR
jgi:Predicted hydrolases or acyltransferases (alpha/beta hydrolase superfamily)